MLRLVRRCLIAIAAAGAAGAAGAGCTDPAGPGPAPGPPEVTDVRVPIPAPDPSFVDVISPDLSLEPGQEAIYCFYLDNPIGRFGTDRLVVPDAVTRHHVALRRATQRRPHGTFEDCTHDQEDLQLGDLFVGSDLPAGWAAEIPADAQLVLEMHYLNTTDLPLLARDVIRMHRVPDAEIAHWVHALHMKTYDLIVPPGDSARAFDCTTATDVTLYEHWGHQHYAARRFAAEITRPGAPAETLYTAEWGVDPAVRGSLSAPIPIPAGTRFRITCEWTNATGRPITFPEEMCAFGGIVEGAEISCAAPTVAP